VIDVSNSAFPSLAGSVSTGGAKELVIDGTYAYVAAGSSGLKVVDISNPSSPTVVGSADTRNFAWDVSITGSIVYVADYGSGVQVFDVSNPTAPLFVGGADTPWEARGIAVADGYVYVADALSGFLVLPTHCADPSAVELSSFDATASPEGILLSWSTSFESSHLGFRVHRGIGAHGDHAPLTKLIEPPGPYRYLDADVTPGTTYLYRLEAVDRAGGSEFYGPVAATALARAESPHYLLSQNYPNPFVAERGATAIGFVLGKRGPAKLRIFDATGRLVRVLVDAPLDAGPHAAWWDGRIDGGTEVGSGIYYYRLEAGEFSEARALVKIR
jgi:hypothetical protein